MPHFQGLRLPALFRFSFDPGNGKAPRLVDVGLASAIPSHISEAAEPYALTVLKPSATMTRLRQAGWRLCLDPSGNIQARQHDKRLDIEPKATTPYGVISTEDFLYAEAMVLMSQSEAS
ncbi:hypothetical protein [Achromobacter xylosoxidans]|uniref:hypothetical protein n=1 Tax=Alcaligenes xylosoxydans xylosoxydans TaxID=85698 RepID=UPI0006C5F7C2|nr:hypothetical protein [Achromobacter xylosoxidans]CUK07026.1 Uncharacterised protein [Achromobacter xylosoxidans]